MKHIEKSKMYLSFISNPKHTFLYRIDSLNNFIPLNEIRIDKWNSYYVRMPCSPLSLYPIVKDGKKSLSQRWKIIKDALKSIPKDIYDVKRLILSYNSRFESEWNFEALIQLFENELTVNECELFFNVTYPGMVELAVNLPDLVSEAIPLLLTGDSHSISFTQLQVASLLANAFFCTFPRRNSSHPDTEFKNYPTINFSSLFSLTRAAGASQKFEKLKCILNYFNRVITERPDGVITFTRRCLNDSVCWKAENNEFQDISLEVDNGSIFSRWTDSIKIDFANEFPGGGVLNHGCVQEEILFMTHPELIVSRLFTERLGDRESLLVQGVQLYSLHSGYADTFKFIPGVQFHDVERDAYGRLKTVISMIDAIFFYGNAINQFKLEHIERELNKAYCGFGDLMPWNDKLPAKICTGNWGCGAFRGDYQLKFIVQIMACASLGKKMVYCTFEDSARKNEIADMFQTLQNSHSNTGQLWSLLAQYYPVHRDTKIFDYLRNCLLK